MKLSVILLVVAFCVSELGMGNPLSEKVPNTLSKYKGLAHLLSVQQDNVTGINAGSPYDCGKEGFAVCGRCMFIAYLNFTRDIDYDEAIALCEAGGGSLAEILSKDDEVALNDYMAPRLLPRRNWVYLWMGMRYNYENRTVVSKSGKEKPIDDYIWYGDYPIGKDPYMMVEASGWSHREYRATVWNQPRNYTMHGVLCEKELWQQ